MTATVLNIKIEKVESKIPNDDNAYVTTQELHKLTGENFKERSKQAGLVSKNI